MTPLDLSNEVLNEGDSWETIMFLYDAALQKIMTRISTINGEFIHMHKYNPIEHVKSRIKSPQSIIKKLKRQGHEDTIQNMVKYINDIAGVRIICSFTSDIYQIADMINKQKDLVILEITDYLQSPKKSGYRSYHMLVAVPVYLTDRVVNTKVEIQIRTIAQDFWASLEHKIYYKFEGNAPEFISHDLRACADFVSELDDKMLSLNEAIQQYSPDNKQEAEEANADVTTNSQDHTKRRLS